ncbi:glycosyltransferase [Jeotgalicoccus sp. ATCC 8456]|uniref:glycosyltransferase n=1 Tax=Jeotgalicoccus sp. ATCC 8456 TaxID=946435 RepID=UPI0018E642F8|nr:glycosyltransferase [Jeotgalicoccus sp. ATCC 8456]QQD85677.1 glycosyltransferase [Jeotgalicoccus sp. ATCC 8456]
MAKFHDVDTYGDLFNKDVSTSEQYHDLTLEEYYKLFNQQGKPNLVNEIETLSEHVVDSNGSRIFKKINLNVGIICDEFLYEAYKDVVNLQYINYNKDYIDTNFDFVIIATTWKGIDGSWQNVAKDKSEERHHLYDLILELQDRKIPTLFYSKEDPVNYDQFVEIAKKCDYVFTSAEEIIPRYVQAVGHDRVYKLEFGINPHKHNPIGINVPEFKDYKSDVIFAGSWMVKYPVRNQESAMAFDGVRQSNNQLTIIDRNLKLENKRYHFPPKYMEHLSYPLPHDLLMKSHKIYRNAINVNSVKYSNTMFANRVYELQAFGNILMSNFSVGVNSKFPHIFIFNYKTDVPQFLKYTSERAIREISSAGIRQTMNNETTYHRIQYISEILGHKIDVDNAKVLVVLKSNKNNADQMVKAQSYQDIDFINRDELKDIGLSPYRFVAYFDNEKYYYEENYIEELVSGFKYADVDFVTKDNQQEKYNFTDNFKDLALTMFDLTIMPDGSIDTVKDKVLSGLNIDDTEVVEHSSLPRKSERTNKLSVVVPIHNNGRYLENKCLRSLKRQSVYNDMEIIFVNDGSTDEQTINIINRLIRRNPDIVYHEFEKASGSASTPRNKGVELASTELITFLDPDNEATGDGFSKLLSEIESDDTIDMVVGNMVKEDQNEKSVFNYYKTVQHYNFKNDVIDDTKGFLKRSYLKAQSIQAMIIRKSVIIENNIKMVEGAIGQDTIYYQELLLNSNKVKAINEVIHMYYGAVADSVTNTVGLSFFEKYLKLEKYRIHFLEENDLINEYIEDRLEYYLMNWYLPRLERVDQSKQSEAAETLQEIFNLYEKYVGDEYEIVEEKIKDYIQT